jgi:hypothetical protein
MQSNLSVNNYKPAFGIKVNEKFIKAAHNYYNGVEYRPEKVKLFDKRVQEAIDTLGYDEFELVYKNSSKNGNPQHILYATKEGMQPVLITKKDQFRKVIEKFRHLNKHELYTKIHQAQVEQGLK